MGADEATVDGLARVTGELQELCTEITKKEQEKRRKEAPLSARGVSGGGDAAVGSLQGWFSKYGEPKRQIGLSEMGLSMVMKPRRRAHEMGGNDEGFSCAQGMRKGRMLN